ncbi:MAG: non-homologous end-joining DNA ligase [Bacillota bacterium]|nr:non-homologous end-joining DNA ligase [Bacillota bacterium]
MGYLQVRSRRVPWSHPSRRLLGRYDKEDLLRYYLAVAPWFLPHLQDRPLVLTRYPRGIEEEGFYQKNVDMAPPWLATWKDPAHPEAPRYLLCQEEAALAWMAQMAVLEVHPWYSRRFSPDEPDWAVVDLDPMAPATFEDAREVAKVLRDYFQTTGIAAFIKTSGATGLHIYLPLGRGWTYGESRELAHLLGEALAALWPEKVTLERRVERRGGRVYWDYLQNGRGKTLAAPYSPRPAPHGPVSTPFLWEELEQVDAARWTLETVPGYLSQRGDPWREITGMAQDLRPFLLELKRKAGRPRQGRRV